MNQGQTGSVLRRPSVIASALVACVALGAVGIASAASKAASAASKPVPIAVFDGSRANPYYAADLKGIQMAVKKYGGTIAQVFDANFDPTTQFGQVQDALSEGKFRAFVVMPVDGVSIAPVIKKAVQAHIKVVCLLAQCGPTYNSLKPYVKGSYFVGQTYSAQGVNIAKATAQACAGKKPCQVLYMSGQAGTGPDPARTEAYVNQLKTYHNIQLVESQPADYTIAKGQTVTQDALQAHPGINVIASAGDEMIEGAQAVLKQQNKTDVKLVGLGASAAAVKQLKAKKWFASITLLPFSEGYDGTKVAIQAVQGKKVPTTINTATLSPVGPIVTTKNVHKFTPQWAG
jgi:ribose transport system substrate-binding protein